MIRAYLITLMMGVAVLLAQVVEGQEAPRTLVEKRVKSLGKIPRGLRRYDIFISPDGQRMAYRSGADTTAIMVLEGKGYGPPYACGGPGSAIFSPDSKRFAYRAGFVGKLFGGQFVAVDGKFSKAYDDVTAAGLLFSPDSRHLAYEVGYWGTHLRPIHWEMMCDEKAVFKGGQSGQDMAFSPDSRFLAFTAKLEYASEKTRMYKFDLTNLERKPEVGPLCDRVDEPVFSPDSKRLAYTASDGGVDVLICDGVIVSRDNPEHDRLVFSPDSQELAYEAGPLGGRYLVWGEKRFPGPIGDPGFSPDGRRLAWGTWFGEGQHAVVCNGKVGPACSSSSRFVFSPDSAHLAYLGYREDMVFLVCDDRAGSARRRNAGVFASSKPVFSPDSKHVAYHAYEKGKQFIVCDGIEGPRHTWAQIPMTLKYESHNRHGEYVAGGDTLRYVVCDDDAEVWLVEVEWPKDLDWTNGLKAIDADE